MDFNRGVLIFGAFFNVHWYIFFRNPSILNKHVFCLTGHVWLPYQTRGGGNEGNLEKIKEKLNTGKYTILNTCEETHAGMNRVFVLLGKIKK